MTAPRKILIVDDSIVFRSQIRAAMGDLPGFEVVGTASNGKIACDMLAQQPVDVVTLDLEMPVMNGLETLAEIKRRGIRAQIIVFSSHSVAGAEATLAALNAGASDFITKPDLTQNLGITPSEAIRKELLPRLQQLTKGFTITQKPATPLLNRFPKLNWELFFPKVIVIASSTGGPKALEDLMSTLKPPVSCPILIAQHMPPLFTASLASRLEKLSGIPATEAKHGEALLPGKIYIAPGDFHFSVEGTLESPKAVISQGPQRNSVRPCADYLFESAAAIYKERTLGIVLTGMGADGADGALAVKNNRGGIIIQSKESCVVFGMPGAVYEAQSFDKIGTPKEIAQMIADLRLSGSFKKTGT